jgi:hypothetical protein
MRQFRVTFLVADEGLVTEEEAIAVLTETLPRQLTHECRESNDRLFLEEISQFVVTLVGE